MQSTWKEEGSISESGSSCPQGTNPGVSSALVSYFHTQHLIGSTSWGFIFKKISRIQLLLMSLLLPGPSHHHVLPRLGHQPPKGCAYLHSYGLLKSMSHQVTSATSNLLQPFWLTVLTLRNPHILTKIFVRMISPSVWKQYLEKLHTCKSSSYFFNI